MSRPATRSRASCPAGAPVLDLTVPESAGPVRLGPTGYGLASLAYPGGLIVNLGSLIAQAGAGADPTLIPDYPLKAEAFFPSGPLERPEPGVGNQSARSTNLGVEALGTYPGVDADPVIKVASVTSNSRASIEDGKAVSRHPGGRSAACNLLGGVITIDALETDLVAAHDGTTGTTAGGTKATGVRFLGLAAELSEDGLVLDDAPPATGPGRPAGHGLLNPILDPLAPLTGPVKDLAQGRARPGGAQPRRASWPAPGSSSSSSAAARSRSTAGHRRSSRSGLSLTFSYRGTEQAQLGELIESIPPELRPNLGPLPNPISFLTEQPHRWPHPRVGHRERAGRPALRQRAGRRRRRPRRAPVLHRRRRRLRLPRLRHPDPRRPGGPAGAGDLGDAISAIAERRRPRHRALLLLLAGAGFMSIATTRLADNVLAPVSTPPARRGSTSPLPLRGTRDTAQANPPALRWPTSGTRSSLDGGAPRPPPTQQERDAAASPRASARCGSAAPRSC